MPSKKASTEGGHPADAPLRGGDLHTLKRKATNTLKLAKKAIEVIAKGEPLSLKRTVGTYPPQMRALIQRVGSEPITSLTVSRTPIQSFVSNLLNVVSFGTYQKAVHDSSYDSMFHLALLINGRYILDKQAVVKLVDTMGAHGMQGGLPSNAETQQVPLNQQVTISELIDKTKASMGAKRFSNYNARTENCQDFILAVLEANGLLTDDLRTFIKQDADAVFRKMPSLSEKIAGLFTDIGAVADVVVEGQGKKSKAKAMPKKETAWTRHVKATLAENKGKSFKDVLKLASASYKKDSSPPTVTKATTWQSHVKATLAQNKGKSFKEVLKIASASYKK